MKSALLIILLSIYAFACSGDCMSCHPVLKESIKKPHHQILNSCIQCHTKVPEAMSECGGDCFACHSQNKLIKSDRKEHQNLSTCKECHISKEDLFKTPPSLDNNSNLLQLLGK